MDVATVSDQPPSPSYRERTVSDLASMFEAKIRNKVESSPYLKHYRRLDAYRVDQGNSITNNRSRALWESEKTTKGNSRASTEREFHGNGDGNVAGNSCSKSPFLDINSVEVSQLESLPNCTAGKPFENFHQRSSPCQKTGIKGTTIIQSQEEKNRKSSLESVKTRKNNRRKSSSKPERAKSFAGGLQRLIKMDKRRGSLDEREIDRLRNGDAFSQERNSVDSSPLFDFSNKRQSRSRVGSDSDSSTPKSILTRNIFDISNEDIPEKPMKTSNGRLRRLKGFFRAISYTNVSDVKRHGELCSICQQKQVHSSMDVHIDGFNKVKDERDHLRRERDSAIREWSEAATKWEHVLDEMDSLLVELFQVKKERDEKAKEISELVSNYQEDIRILDDHRDLMNADLSDIASQLAVAKKERLDSLAEYDQLLKRHYDMCKEIDAMEDDNSKLRSDVKDKEQTIDSLHQQVANLQQERDHALQLWNSSVEERKKLHQEMESLIQSRDTSLRKAFQQAEELNKVKEERDALRRALVNNKRNGTLESKDSGRSSRCMSQNDSGYATSKEQDVMSCNSTPLYTKEDALPDFIDFAVSVDRLDSKFGIKLEDAVDEPNVMIAHVGAHVSSKNDIKKYDRILSMNGVNVVRSDKKTVEKLIRDCVGMLTMVLRRERSITQLENKMKDIHISLPKAGSQQAKRSQQGLGTRFKVQVMSVENPEFIVGNDEISPGDVITKINTQSIDLILEALINKFAKRNNGKVTFRIRKSAAVEKADIDDNNLSLPKSAAVTVSLSDISHSSNLSLASFSSEQTTATTCTDESGSLFSGSLTPSIALFPFNEGGNDDDDIMSLPARLRKLSNPFPENIGFADKYSSNSHSQERLYSRKEDAVSNGLSTPNANGLSSRKSSETRSFRSLKNAYSSRAPLRRARSNAVELKSVPKDLLTPENERNVNRPSVLAEMPVEQDCHSWILPSPDVPRKEDQNDNTTLNIFATLPRKKKKNVNQADCNKRSAHRVLRLEKQSHEPLGFDICGGNKVGIFVKSIEEGSMAALGDMKVGDRILYINAFDLNGATLDFAMRVVLRNERLTSFRIEVTFEQKFKDIMKILPRDSVYVRTIRSSESCENSDIQFGIGEILHVTNTLANFDKTSKSWNWYAEKVSRKSSGEAGHVPRLERFINEEDVKMPGVIPDVDVDPDRTPTNQKKKRRRSAVDVKKWLLRKPSINRKKKEHDMNASVAEFDDQTPFYEILMEK